MLLFLAPARPAYGGPTERQLRQVVAQADRNAQRRFRRSLTHFTAVAPTIL